MAHLDFLDLAVEEETPFSSPSLDSDEEKNLMLESFTGSPPDFKGFGTFVMIGFSTDRAFWCQKMAVNIVSSMLLRMS